MWYPWALSWFDFYGYSYSVRIVPFPVLISHAGVPWTLIFLLPVSWKREFFISFLTLPDRASTGTCNILLWIRQKPFLLVDNFFSRAWHTGKTSVLVKKRCSLWTGAVLLQDPCFALQSTVRQPWLAVSAGCCCVMNEPAKWHISLLPFLAINTRKRTVGLYCFCW